MPRTNSWASLDFIKRSSAETTTQSMSSPGYSRHQETSSSSSKPVIESHKLLKHKGKIDSGFLEDELSKVSICDPPMSSLHSITENVCDIAPALPPKDHASQAAKNKFNMQLARASSDPETVRKCLISDYCKWKYLCRSI
jgi:hypothetical protein